jgi:VWFA-related protein
VILLAALLLAASLLPAETKITATVVDSKSGQPATSLTAADFTLLDDKTPRKILSAEFTTGIVDVMMLLDSSLVGELVRPAAAAMINELKEKEQMAIVSFHSSADLIQDFTSSRELLMRAVSGVKYGNSPSVLDALYAAIDGGFQNATYRRVVLLLSAGVEGRSRVTEKQVVKLARRNGVSVYPVYVMGNERWMFESLARQTGGAVFSLRGLKGEAVVGIGRRIFDVVRGSYTLTAAGNLALGEKLKLEINQPGKWFASALPLE